MSRNYEKGCYCFNCKKDFNHLGIMRHRAMHRDKKEKVKIMYGDGTTYVHDYSK